MRKGWGTTAKYKLHSTPACRVAGVCGSSAVSFKVLEENGMLVVYGPEAISFAAANHHREDASAPVPSSSPYNYLRFPYGTEDVRLCSKLFSLGKLRLLGPHSERKEEESVTPWISGGLAFRRAWEARGPSAACTSSQWHDGNKYK
uniref:Uncharacterized protein n=1 Tax=Molossus molossus TaxID=27622 RepID=A0A7J8FSD5_MOLMO|nr:hypothetical protein HJG59_008365 [Molossus molossus]